MYKKILACCLHSIGVNHHYTAHTYQELSNIYRKMDKSEEAFFHLEKAYLITEATQKKYTDRTGTLSSQLAQLCLNQGRFKESIHYSTNAIIIWRKIDEKKHNLSIVTALINIGVCYERQFIHGKVSEILNQCCLQIFMHGIQQIKPKVNCLVNIFTMAFRTQWYEMTLDKKSLLFRLSDSLSDRLWKIYGPKYIRNGIEAEMHENCRVLLAKIMENSNIIVYLDKLTCTLISLMQELFSKGVSNHFYELKEEYDTEHSKEIIEDFVMFIKVLGTDFFYALLKDF